MYRVTVNSAEYGYSQHDVKSLKDVLEHVRRWLKVEGRKVEKLTITFAKI